MNTQLSTNRKSNRMFANILSIVVILAIAFPAVGSAYAQDIGPKVGLIATTTGIADDSFNAMAYQGLLRAATDLGVDISIYEPQDQSEYESLMQQCADENELCIVVGFEFRFSLPNIARANPDIMWGIIDWSYPDCWEGALEGVDCGSFTEIPNVRGLRFNEKQAGYLAGVLAGGMTASDVVGAVGGMDIPPVVAFVEGYRNGAQCTNPDMNVLTTYTGTFSDPDLGAYTAQEMIAQGADVIFGAAGLTGNGAILYSAQNGQWAVGVDTDQYFTVFGNGTVTGSDKILSSAIKRVDNAVYQTIEALVNGVFTSGTVVYDLAVDGIGLAPFHEADGSIPQEVKDELDAVQQDIIEGKINIDDSCAPPPPPNPFIAVSLTQHWFWVNNFMPETLVTFSIYDTQGDESPILEFSKPTDTLGNLTIDGWAHIWDPEPGDYIVATDGLTTKDLVLEYITLDVFDPENDLVSGHALPGREVGVGVGNENGEQWMNVFADDQTGIWVADFTLQGFEFDITEDSWAGGHVSDEDGDVTAAHNSGPPEPPAWFTAFPEQDAVEAWDWPLGAVVHLAIDDPTTEDSPDYEQDETVTFTPWGSWQLWVWFDFAGMYDMKAGDIVTLSYGETVRTHTVQNLSVTKVAQEDDTVKGIADPGAEVYVWPHATGQEQLAVAKLNGKAMGKWNADFSGIFDLVPGECGRSEIRDEFGNRTAVDWCVPNPRIIASITEDWFYLVEFTPGANLELSIYSGQGGSLIWQGTRTADVNGFAWIDTEGWDLQPGNHLIVSDGNTTKDLVIEGFTFDVFDLSQGLLQGTSPGPDGRLVWAGIGFENDGWSMDVFTDADGNWVANFGNPVPADYWWVAAQIFDDDGDATELRPDRIVDLWVAAYTYDYGTWAAGNHSYHFEATWTDGSEITDEIFFNVSNEAELYEGFALLRPGAVRAGADCPAVDAIRPDQSTRFLSGYVTDQAMTYEEAMTFFESLTAEAVWDGGMSAELAPHEIIQFRWDVWFQYVCTFTSP